MVEYHKESDVVYEIEFYKSVRQWDGRFMTAVYYLNDNWDIEVGVIQR